MNNITRYKLIILPTLIILLAMLVFSCKLLCTEDEETLYPRIAFLKDRDLNNELWIEDKDLWIMDRNGSNKIQLSDGLLNILYFIFSQDGSMISFSAGNNEESNIFIMNVDGSNLQQLTNFNRPSYPVSFFFDDSKILFNSNIDYYNSDIFTMNIDGTNKTNLTEDLTTFQYAEDVGHSILKIIYISQHPNNPENSALYIMNFDGSDRKCLTCDLNDISLPSFPTIPLNNGKIVFRNGNQKIDIMDIDGNNHKNIVKYDVFKFIWNPIIAPSGQYILYEISSGVHPNGVSIQNIYSVLVDGSNERNLTDSIGSAYSPDISEDEEHIIFGSFRDWIAKIYIMNKDGSNQIYITNGSNPKFQPNS